MEPAAAGVLHRLGRAPLNDEACQLLGVVRRGATKEVATGFKMADSNQKMNWGTPTLIWAAARGYEDMVQLLMQHGAGNRCYQPAADKRHLLLPPVLGARILCAF